MAVEKSVICVPSQLLAKDDAQAIVSAIKEEFASGAMAIELNFKNAHRIQQSATWGYILGVVDMDYPLDNRHVWVVSDNAKHTFMISDVLKMLRRVNGEFDNGV